MPSVQVCVYYCRTYSKAVCGGGRGTVKDMCYEVRRAEACVVPNTNLCAWGEEDSGGHVK
jgi:hypothetical protein